MNKLQSISNKDLENIYNKICERIKSAKVNIAIKVNNEITLLYWNIGKDITENVLDNEKPDYGKAVIESLSKKLLFEYGRGYSKANIFKMIKLYRYFSNFEIFLTLSRKLSWSHFVELIQIQDNVKREFYVTMCMNENWSVRTLRERIDSALFERTAISKKPEQTILNDLKLLTDENKMTTELFFRDPYILDFLGLKDTYKKVI